jgi:hypothetical protein
LPYGIKAEIKYYDGVCKLQAIYTNGTTYATRDEGYPIETYFEDCKPFLFPMSSMTEEQENEWTDLRLNPLGEILEGKFNGKEEHMQLLSKSMSDPTQWCYKNHFDCNGLIPLGLAINATSKNIY